MKRIILSSLFYVLFCAGLLAQNYTISGYISDSKSSETLISSSVYEENTSKGAVSNTYGFYSLTIPKGNVSLLYSYVGYSSQQRSFTLSKDTIINIKLNQTIELKEVTVIGNQKEIGVRGSQMSAIEVPISQIKSIPTLFGETDVLKALQLLPGVQAGVEGSAGFYVRGGGPDENLFLLDGVPIYNVNHMGGFFSIFNADALKNVTLYKGGFPARFGGRLSSVVDIQMKDGNNDKLHGNFSVGLISSKFNLEGPLFSKKTTFNISGRRTYYDALAQPIMKIYAAENDVDKFSAGYYFYDLNAKITHTISDKDKLFLSTYVGDDVIYANIRESFFSDKNYSSESRIKMDWNWGNLISAMRWNHVINNKLFMNTTATFTRYRFDMAMGYSEAEETKTPPTKTSNSTTIGYNSGITDYGLKFDFDYAPAPNHDVKFGANYTNHSFKPGVKILQSKYSNDSIKLSNDTTIGDAGIFAQEINLYVEDNISLNSIFKINAGAHYTAFFVQGEAYHSIEPRFSLRAMLSNDISVKAGYAVMNQNIHLLSNSNISLPTDLWVPVTKRIKPMQSQQVSAGVFYNMLNTIDLSVEGYYKSMKNLIEYKDGASFLDSGTGWEDKVSIGRGWAYGVEFLAQKSIGNTTGWVGYTWSKTERLFDRPGEMLNDGKVFPAKYDRRNDLSIVVSHTFNKKIDVAGTWVYSTGNCGSLALQNYSATNIDNSTNYYGEQSSIPHLSQRNNYRLPDYHRLDLSVNFHKQLKHGERTWNLSVYNAYNNKNPFLVYVKTNYDYTVSPVSGNQGYNSYTYTERKSLNKLTIFTIIPSISYSYKF